MQMIDGRQAFLQFKQLVRGLREWGYDVHEEDDWGEFSINGFVCSYRYFGVLDLNFLAPGQTLTSQDQPDLMFQWDGKGWREVTEGGLLEVRRSNLELFNRCLKRVNYEVAPTLGFSPHMCLLVLPQLSSPNA